MCVGGGRVCVCGGGPCVGGCVHAELFRFFSPSWLAGICNSGETALKLAAVTVSPYSWLYSSCLMYNWGKLYVVLVGLFGL